jgi:hypothetical protein
VFQALSNEVANHRGVFRGNLHDALKQVFAGGELQFHGRLKTVVQPRFSYNFLRLLFRHHWVVYCKPPVRTVWPSLIADYFPFNDERIAFRYRDSAHKNKQRLHTISDDEFLRRSLFHVLPCGFVHIRLFGIANRCRGKLIPLSE